MLIATLLIGYVAAAATFYIWSAKSAMEVEETRATMPARVLLTVVEGGQSGTSDYQAAA